MSNGSSNYADAVREKSRMISRVTVLVLGTVLLVVGALVEGDASTALIAAGTTLLATGGGQMALASRTDKKIEEA